MSIRTEISNEAIALLQTCLETRRVVVTPENREVYRELARAEIMFPVSGFVNGEEAVYRFSDDGWQWVTGPCGPFSSLADSPAPVR
jgi:hypothetical protein